MKWPRKLRKPATIHREAGWECMECGHREYCTQKETFWQDTGSTLYIHRNQHHPGGQDYVMHVPHGWERKKDNGS